VFFTHTLGEPWKGLVEAEVTEFGVYLNPDPYNQALSYLWQPTIPLNTWFHFAWTMSGTTGRVYLNGTLRQSQNNMVPALAIHRPYCFIGYAGGLNNRDYGGIDDIKIYNRALSDSEVLADFNLPAYA
jgi:hypothetical protein